MLTLTKNQRHSRIVRARQAVRQLVNLTRQLKTLDGDTTPIVMEGLCREIGSLLTELEMDALEKTAREE